MFSNVLLLFLGQYVDFLRRLASWKILEELRLVSASCDERKLSFISLCRSSHYGLGSIAQKDGTKQVLSRT